MTAKSSADVLAALGKTLAKRGETRTDGWENCLSGLGTTRDKTKASRLRFRGLYQPEQIDVFYVESDLVRTVCGAIVEDALAQGFELKKVPKAGEEHDHSPDKQGSEQDEIREKKAELDDLCLTELVQEGAIWGRAYGRGGLLLIVQGQDPETPMTDGGELLDMIVVDKRELSPCTYYKDPLAAKYGQPETYYLQITAAPTTAAPLVVVHETRLILFGGVLTPKRMKIYNDGADMSVLQGVLDIIAKAEGNFDSMCAAIADMSQGVIMMDGLIDAVAAGKSEDISTRIALMDQMRSITRSLLLDAENEDFKYVERAALSGLADLLDKTWIRLAAACEPAMPVTRLMGIAPAGLNATGEGDRINWYDKVRTYQRKHLKPAMDKLVKLILGEGWEVEFPDLEKQDPLEQAQIMQAQAATDQTYVTMGTLTPAEIGMVRFGKGHWSAGYDGIDMEAHEAALERELDELENPPEPVTLGPDGAPIEGVGPPGAKPAPGAKPGDGPEAEAGPATDPKGAKGEGA